MDPRNAARTSFMTLKSRIMVYTIVPAAVILVLAAVFIATSIYRLINSYSYDQITRSMELICNRVESVFDEYGQIAVESAQKEDLQKFLISADDRDEMEENGYFSRTMGELDSVMSDHIGRFDRTWIYSVSVPGVAFSNSSAGWTARPDFSMTRYPFYHDAFDAADYYLSDPYTSPMTDDIVVSVIAPIKDNRSGKVLGFFCGDINFNYFTETIRAIPGVWEEENYTYVRSEDGLILFDNHGESLFRRFKSLGLEYIETSAGTRRYLMNERHFVGYERYPASSHWTVYSLYDYSDTTEMVSGYVRTTVLTFVAVALTLFMTISIVSRKIAKPIQDYTRMINTLHLDGSDNEIARLVPTGCRELEHFAIGFNALIDRNTEIMSQLREMNIQSEKERILYQTAIQSSSDVVFEYDIATDVLITYGSLFDSTMPKTYENVIHNFFADISAERVYSTEDISKTEAFFTGSGVDEAVISKTLPDGTVRWFCLEGTAVFADSHPVKIVGKIKSIDDVVSLREDAERDMFSGFYNKITTEKLISRKLEESDDVHAMIIVDVDNFKNINDLFGHDYGDFVIKDISENIRKNIGNEDIVGRVGGDEFMIFAKDDEEHKNIIRLCEALVNAVRYTYTDDKGGKVAVSASIGVAFAPENGKYFEELYRCADIAMYSSKTAGKDRYTIYSGQSRPEYKGR